MKRGTGIKKGYSISLEAGQSLRRIDTAYRDSYNAVSDEDLAEETAWAAFAEREMAELSN